MRPIKFRVWDTLDKIFLKGGWTKQDGFGEGGIKVCLSTGGPIFYDDSDGGKDGLHEHVTTVPDDRFIIEEFTGLHDKNGREIYEGDIVRTGIKDYSFGEIIFRDGGFKWGFIPTRPNPWIHIGVMAPIIIVIGNIHENPGLLK